MSLPLTHRDLSVWLINLDRADARRAAMQPRLAALGLDYRPFSAVDGRARWNELAPSVDIDAFERNAGRKVIPGEIGCYHSHLGVWRAFLETGAPVALVLEDDVVFHDDFLEALDAALRVRNHWDFLKLNKIRAKQPVRQGRVGRWSLNAYLGPATGFGAYLITSDLAGRLLPDMLPITRPIDHEADRIHRHRFRHLGLEPFPSHVEDGGDSTITGRGFAGVEKYVWYRRLPHYQMKFATLLQRFFYLLRSGAIPGNAADLDGRGR